MDAEQGDRKGEKPRIRQCHNQHLHDMIHVRLRMGQETVYVPSTLPPYLHPAACTRLMAKADPQ
jgi:hypothetical protein